MKSLPLSHVVISYLQYRNLTGKTAIYMPTLQPKLVHVPRPLRAMQKVAFWFTDNIDKEATTLPKQCERNPKLRPYL